MAQSHAFAQEEVERYRYRMPGQAISYFYGFTGLIDLRKETEATLGPQFNQKLFHPGARPVASRSDKGSGKGKVRTCDQRKP